jgi:hypothetical protein
MLSRFLERCDRWLEKHFGGHWSAGPLTVYGWNAMHVAVNWRTRRWGYVCFHPPLYWCGQWWPWYFYLSPNATPWASTFLAGPAHVRKKSRTRGSGGGCSGTTLTRKRAGFATTNGGWPTCNKGHCMTITCPDGTVVEVSDGVLIDRPDRCSPRPSLSWHVSWPRRSPRA